MNKQTNDALNGIIDAINVVVEDRVSKSEFDKTKNAQIILSKGNNTYDVLLQNKTYTLKSNGDTSYNAGDIVKVMIPQNNSNMMFILGGGGSSTPSGTTNYADLTNKPQINTITLNGGNNVLTTNNIPDSTNKRYVSDLQLSILSNTTASFTTTDETKLDGIETNANNYIHPTQTAIASDNSNGVVIQDISVNTLGHVASVGTVDLDSRYYTETEINNLLNNKQSTSEKGQLNGYASLDVAGKVPSAQLPSYVDDVLEYPNLASFPVTGEAGKIYIALDTNKTYRWSGSTYVYITSGAVDSVDGRTGVIVLNDLYEPKNANIQSHISSTSNPHGVTTTQIGAEPAFTKNTAFNKNFGTTAGTVTEGSHVGATGSAHGTATTSVNGFMSSTDKTKIDGIESGAEVNNISDTNATDLTDAGDTTLHYHSADRNRANHTGTQLAATISDFAATVRTTVLTGLSTATNAVVLATDTILVAIGKLQKQISDHIADAVAHITAGERTTWNAKLDASTYTATDILTKIKTVDGNGSGLDADLLDGQHGAYYLDWTNATNKPDPIITLSGDLSGSGTMTDLGNVTITAAVANNSHNHIASNISDFDTEVSNNTDVVANTSARHTHSNKAILDATTASFTTADETKLDGIEAGAEVNNISDVNAIDLTDGGETILHTHNGANISQTIYTTTTAVTEGWYRIATVPIDTQYKQVTFRIKGYTATGTTTESKIDVNLGYYSGNYTSQVSAITCNTSHSFNSETNAENGWVIRYCRVSFDATNAYIDMYKYKTTAVTMETQPLTLNDWAWATGALIVNPTVGAYRNATATMSAGLYGNNIYAGSSGSSSYSNYGVFGTNTLSNTTNKAGQWAYFGSCTIDYNSAYLRGRSLNTRCRLQEMSYDGTVLPNEMDDFVLNIQVNLGYHADGTAFNALVPTFDMNIEGQTSLTVNDICGLVYSTSTTQKVIRFYVKLKAANTVYGINPEQRYGRAFATSTYSQTTSYMIFSYAGDQTPIAALPTPAQGSVVYPNFKELNSPTLVGIPTAPTAILGTNTTQIATTQFVQSAVGSSTSDFAVIKTQATEPTTLREFDIWYKTLDGT